VPSSQFTNSQDITLTLVETKLMWALLTLSLNT